MFCSSKMSMFDSPTPQPRIRKGRKTSFISWDDETDDLPPVPHQRQSGQKSYWLVTNDPSGDFIGRSFRTYDLNAREKHWAVGTVFENQKTGERKRWTRNGFVEMKAAKR